MEAEGITIPAPRWTRKVTGTKHGDWQPYFDARRIANEHGADISLLFDNDSLVDGDRCMPVLLDNDGAAYYPKPSEGALDSVTLEQIRDGIEAAGVPIREARITLSMILRASEMIVLGSGLGVQAIGEIDSCLSPDSPCFSANEPLLEYVVLIVTPKFMVTGAIAWMAMTSALREF